MGALAEYEFQDKLQLDEDAYDLDENQLERIEDFVLTMTGESQALGSLDQSWGIEDVEKVRINHPVSDNSHCPEEAEDGDMFTSPGGRHLWSRIEDRDDPWNFVVVFAFLSRVRFEENGKSFCSSFDAEHADDRDMLCENCPDLPWAQGEKTDCNNQLNFIVLDTDLTDVFQLQFKKSNFQEGRTIQKALKKTSPGWNKVFSLKTIETSNESNTWDKFKVGITNQEAPEHVMAAAPFVSEQYREAREEKLEEMHNRRQDAADVAEGMDDEGGDENESFEHTM